MKVSPRSKLLSGTEGAGLLHLPPFPSTGLPGTAKALSHPGGTRGETRAQAGRSFGGGGTLSPLLLRPGCLAPRLSARPPFFWPPSSTSQPRIGASVGPLKPGGDARRAGGAGGQARAGRDFPACSDLLAGPRLSGRFLSLPGRTGGPREPTLKHPSLGRNVGETPSPTTEPPGYRGRNAG